MSAMNIKEANSLDLHLWLLEKYNDSRENPTTEEIIAVLVVMANELLVEGRSLLLDCAYSALKKRTKYEPRCFRLAKPTMKKAVSASDAQIWLYLLSGYLKGNADRLAARIAGCQLSLCKITQLDAPDPQAVDRTIRKIDERLMRRRAALLAASAGAVSADTNSSTEGDSDAKAVPDGRPSVRVRAERKDYLELHHREIDFFTQQFNELRPALMETNERMRMMEESIEKKSTEKAYRQMVELYDLIADVKDSTHRIAQEKKNSDLENAAYNLEEFLYMISDALAEYGIDTVTTPPDAPFDGKYHDVGSERNFDPKRATVAESLRSGFVWGDSVMKKERVRLKKQEESN